MKATRIQLLLGFHLPHTPFSSVKREEHAHKTTCPLCLKKNNTDLYKHTWKGFHTSKTPSFFSFHLKRLTLWWEATGRIIKLSGVLLKSCSQDPLTSSQTIWPARSLGIFCLSFLSPQSGNTAFWYQYLSFPFCFIHKGFTASSSQPALSTNWSQTQECAPSSFPPPPVYYPFCDLCCALPKANPAEGKYCAGFLQHPELPHTVAW